jgi:transposase-like protein
MTVKRRKYTPEFKAQVVLEIISGAKTQAEVAREHRIKPDILVRWRRQFLSNAASLFERGNQSDSTAEARIAELERALGQKTLELEAAKKASSIFRHLSGER